MLTTQRLIIKKPHKDDANQLQKLANNFDIAKWTSRIPHPYDRQDAHRYIDYLQADINEWLIYENDNVIGAIGIESELGYWIGEPYWDKGYACEAIKCVIKYYFKINPTQPTMLARAKLDNAKSIHLLQKNGFEPANIEMHYALSLKRKVEIQNFELRSDLS